MSESILEEADRVINGERAENYGDVTENFERIAKLWGAYRGQFFDRHDVAMMMILVKVARQSGGYHRDSVVDIAGYAALDEKVHGDNQDQTKAAPRVWESLDEVPHDVKVVSSKGCHWSYWTASMAENEGWGDYNGHDPGWLWTSQSGDKYDRTSPFTEILEGSE